MHFGVLFLVFFYARTGMSISSYLANQAASKGVQLTVSSASTLAGESILWRRSVSWGVNPMPNKLVALDANSGEVVGASYYDTKKPNSFLSALAVLPEYRGKRIGKLLIAASVEHMRASGASGSTLHVLGCDASVERHSLYTSCGFLGGDPIRGGNYVLESISPTYAEDVLEKSSAPRL
jgi:ribosomal protein S18 acetylase RimI-like enzyme